LTVFELNGLTETTSSFTTLRPLDLKESRVSLIDFESGLVSITLEYF
jgi:hypothetical protein